MLGNVSGTEINYFYTCKTQLWFFAHYINMEDESDTVAAGKITHEYTYTERAKQGKEFEIGRVKIDFFDKKKKIIHEVKHAKKPSPAHEYQVKYYLFVLKENGFGDVKGILEYPRAKIVQNVDLNENDRDELISAVQQIEQIKANRFPPKVGRKRTICKSCSYEDLCFAGEEKESSDAEE